jgi:hypothetical protein
MFLAMAVGLLAAGAALAQTVTSGDPNVGGAADNFDHWREGMPITMQIETQDVKYEFTGKSVDIPFTLNGSRANVYLAVYTEGADPQYDGPGGLGKGGPGNAVLRASGLDTFVVVVGPRLFSEGDNVFSWDGLDFNGNQIATGNYEYFLIGMNDVDKPTYISGSGTVWWQFGIDNKSDPQGIWFGNGGTNAPISRARIGDNLMTNPGAWVDHDVNWMRERTGRDLVADAVWWDIAGWKLDPQDPTIHYANNYNDQGNVIDLGVGFTTGLWKINWDESNGTLLPDEDWGGDADRGWIQHEGNLPAMALMADAHKPWLADDGFIYVSWQDRDYPPNTPGVIKVDRASGTIVDIIDMTDIYVHETPEGEIAAVRGPFGLDVDDRGFYTNGYWASAFSESFPSSIDHDGNIMWINQNGDDFGDRYFGDEATSLGYTQEPTGMLTLHATVGKFHMAINSGMSVPWGSVIYGPDGAGLVKIDGPKRAVGITGHSWWHATDDELAGFFYNSAQGAELHMPFDIENGFISEGVPTAVEEVAAAALPLAYELKDNYPNPFNPETTIEFAVPDLGQALPVTLTVYNLAGQKIAILADQSLNAGSYKSTWDALDTQGQSVGSGVYIYTLTVGEWTESKRMTLMK